MMSFARTPSSMATRVRRGRHSTAMRRSSRTERRERIGLRPQEYPLRLGRKRGASRMKLAVHVGYWGLGLTSQDQIDIIREAERLGYDSVWTAEAYGSDAATILGWIAAQTSKIKIGSAIFQMPPRSAAMTAMTAATPDQLSHGRMLPGGRASGPPASEGWHG